MKLTDRLDKIEKELAAIRKDIQKNRWTKIGDLYWSNDLGSMNWQDAKKACEKLGGRLPTRVELIDLYDSHYEECQLLIDDSPSNYFWSMTENGGGNAWYVYLSNGNTYNNGESYNFQVRCVREDIDG